MSRSNTRIKKLFHLGECDKTLFHSSYGSNVTLLLNPEYTNVSFNTIANLNDAELKSFTLVENQVSRFPDEVRGLAESYFGFVECPYCRSCRISNAQANYNTVYATCTEAHHVCRIMIPPGWCLSLHGLSYGKLSSLDSRVLKQLTARHCLCCLHFPTYHPPTQSPEAQYRAEPITSSFLAASPLVIEWHQNRRRYASGKGKISTPPYNGFLVPSYITPIAPVTHGRNWNTILWNLATKRR
ncbi:hypothetical protein BDQ17DRAFT_1322126 [Cyathus striatus]|nr:hypothetical protein BDQ17DRAFT_1322126 [Cyathus striatus]